MSPRGPLVLTYQVRTIINLTCFLQRRIQSYHGWERTPSMHYCEFQEKLQGRYDDIDPSATGAISCSCSLISICKLVGVRVEGSWWPQNRAKKKTYGGPLGKWEMGKIHPQEDESHISQLLNWAHCQEDTWFCRWSSFCIEDSAIQPSWPYPRVSHTLETCCPGHLGTQERPIWCNRQNKEWLLVFSALDNRMLSGVWWTVEANRTSWKRGKGSKNEHWGSCETKAGLFPNSCARMDLMVAVLHAWIWNWRWTSKWVPLGRTDLALQSVHGEGGWVGATGAHCWDPFWGAITKVYSDWLVPKLTDC